METDQPTPSSVDDDCIVPAEAAALSPQQSILLHPLVLQQSDALQPPWWLVLICFIVPGWLLTLLSVGLVRWPLFVAYASPHPIIYRAVFAIVQFGLMTGGIVYLSRKFRSALWYPPPSTWRRSVAALACLLPILSYHLCIGLSSIRTIAELVAAPQQDIAMPLLVSLYQQSWGALAYGSSFDGVIFSSALSFVTPVLEEIVFSGFVANALVRRFGFTAAVLGTSVCFCFVHAVRFGIGMQLVPVLFAGMTYVIVRLVSGSLFLAVLAHCIVNAVVFLPKWAVAIAYNS